MAVCAVINWGYRVTTSIQGSCDHLGSSYDSGVQVPLENERKDPPFPPTPVPVLGLMCWSLCRQLLLLFRLHGHVHSPLTLSAAFSAPCPYAPQQQQLQPFLSFPFLCSTQHRVSSADPPHPWLSQTGTLWQRVHVSYLRCPPRAQPDALIAGIRQEQAHPLKTVASVFTLLAGNRNGEADGWKSKFRSKYINIFM